MTAERFSIRRALQRAPHAEPVQYAVLRMPTATGEFVAHWPQNATVNDLETMHRFFGACMDGWIVNAKALSAIAQSDAEANAEYESWFAKESS